MTEYDGERFVRTYTQGFVNVTEIWVDQATGVNYLFHASGQSAGLTPLLKPDGTPVVTPVNRHEE